MLLLYLLHNSISLIIGLFFMSDIVNGRRCMANVQDGSIGITDTEEAAGRTTVVDFAEDLCNVRAKEKVFVSVSVLYASLFIHDFYCADSSCLPTRVFDSPTGSLGWTVRWKCIEACFFCEV